MRTSRLRSFSGATFLLALLSWPAGSPPGIDAQPSAGAAGQASAPASARIGGRIVQTGGAAPLAEVEVRLTGNQSRRTTSGEDGRYAFADLPAGTYLLTASKDGYVTMSHGQRRAFEPGRPIALREGETVTLPDLALPGGSVIAGRVTDEFGDPVTGAQIRIERAHYGPGGDLGLSTFTLPGMIISTPMTDDLGEFRIFGLMPGRYVVSARLPARTLTPGPGGAGDRAEGFLPTYYPGTADVAAAQPIDVDVSREVTAHFSMVPGRMLRISGTVRDSRGRPATGMNVVLSTETATSSGSTDGGFVQADGSFSIGNVPPGDYVLRVRQRGGGTGPEAEVASLPISVRTGDLLDLHLTTRPGTTIAGWVEWDGTAPRPATTRISTVSAVPSPGPVGETTFTYLDPARGTVQDDDTFELGGTIGTVLIRASAGSPWLLKAVMVDGIDVTHAGMDAATLGDVRVRVIMTDRSTELAGVVRDGRGQPAQGAVIVLLPEQEMDGMGATWFTRTLRPDQHGAFRVRGLPPGRYVALAVDDIEPGGEWNPAFQRTVRNTGRSFTLADGQALSLNLELLP